MRELWQLFLVFSKIGVTTFGGGYAMMPVIQREIVENKKWATDEQIMDYYAIGQCTPGVIAVNTATFIGYKRKGVLGAICSTLGVVFPSIVIILIIAAFIRQFADLEITKHAFAGIRVAVCVLVLNSVIKLWKNGIKDAFGIILFVAVFVLSVILNISPVYFVIAAILLGITAKKQKKKEENK